MKILFMGTPYFARVILEKILKDSFFSVVGLFTQPDKPFGRKHELKYSATKEFVIHNKMAFPVFQPEILDKEMLQIISELKPDIILVVAYGKILPKEILSLVRCLNVHGSILPKYRGASPIHEMILNDDRIYGVSVIQMQEKLDSGDILGVSAFKSSTPLSFEILTPKLAEMGGELIIKVLKNLEVLKPLKQYQADATYCRKILKEQGLVDFENAKDIYLKSLAYATWPNIFLDSGLKLFKIELISETGRYKKGEILCIDGSAIMVGCLQGMFRVEILQYPGKQKMNAKDYIQGRRLKIGDILI